MAAIGQQAAKVVGAEGLRIADLEKVVLDCGDSLRLPLALTQAEQVSVLITRAADEYGGNTFEIKVTQKTVLQMRAEKSATTAMPDHFPMTLSMKTSGFFLLQDRGSSDLSVSKKGICQKDAKGFLLINNSHLMGWRYNNKPTTPPAPLPEFSKNSMQPICLHDIDEIFHPSTQIKPTLNLCTNTANSAISIQIGSTNADLKTALGNPSEWPVRFTMQHGAEDPQTIEIHATDTILTIADKINAYDTALILAKVKGDLLFINSIDTSSRVELKDYAETTTEEVSDEATQQDSPKVITSLFGATTVSDYGHKEVQDIEMIGPDGLAHQIQLQFKKRGDKSWYVEAHLQNQKLKPEETYIASGILSFKPEGLFDNIKGSLDREITINLPGGLSQTLTINFTDTTETGTDHTLIGITTDGKKITDRMGLELTPEGNVIGKYADGIDRLLWQFAAAHFPSEDFVKIDQSSYDVETETEAMPLSIQPMGLNGASFDKSFPQG